jgi:four helix bundle protein
VDPPSSKTAPKRREGSPFEGLRVWRAARGLAEEIYRVTSTGGFRGDPAVRDQIRRAAVSVMSNIAEGYERDGNREFLQFLALAKGSSGEIRSHLYIAEDQGYVRGEELDRLIREATRISRMISALMKYLRTSELRGRKFPNS